MQTQMISKEAKTQIPFFKSWWCQTSILLDPLHLQPALPMVLPSVSDGAFSTLVWANQSVAVQVWQLVWQVGPGQDASCLPRVHKTHLSITHSSNQRKKNGTWASLGVISAMLPCKWSQFWWNFFQGCCPVQGPTPPLHPRSKGGVQETDYLPGGSWSTYGSLRWSGIRKTCKAFDRWKLSLSFHTGPYIVFSQESGFNQGKP